MSLRKKVKRNLEKKMNGTKKNKVEAINDAAILEALKNEEKSVMILHPTGGYRKFSLARIQFMGNTQTMWAQISETLRKAVIVETVKKDA